MSINIDWVIKMYITTDDVKNRQNYMEYLPPSVRDAIKNLGSEASDVISEIRLKNEGTVSVCLDKLYFISTDGALTQSATNILTTDRGTFFETVDKMSRRSIYAAQNELRHGFLTLEGGHRVGVCGKTVVENGKIIQLSDISSLNLRIAREIKGCADEIIDAVMLKNTLIISPPACGKTTFLRDIARNLSERMIKVGIIDERGEIASSYKGRPQLDVGTNTDVYTNCPKSEGITMLLRSMAPQVIVTDEIGTPEDEAAIFSTINAGVKIVCSAHGYDRDDLHRRGLLKSIMDKNIFETIVVLSRRNGPGTVERVY